MDKNDLYRYFYEKMLDTNDWLSGVGADEAVQAANYVCGMVEFTTHLLDKFDEPEATDD